MPLSFQRMLIPIYTRIKHRRFLLGIMLGLLFGFNLSFHYTDQPLMDKKHNLSILGNRFLHETDQNGQNSSKRLRIFCWIMTTPTNLARRAVHVRNTWAHRCDQHIFISSKANKTFPAIGIDVEEGRKHLTRKTLGGFKYVYEHHFNDADWFIKTDDDAFVIVENLRYFLSGQDYNDPIYFGHNFKVLVKDGYVSGGPGIVVSKEAMRRFGKHINNSKVCGDILQTGSAGDANFGLCMQNLGVKLGNSTDRFGRSRFHCLNAETHLLGKYPKWFYSYDANGAKKGRNSMSDYAIGFHYVSTQNMYLMEYLLYHLRPHGVQFGPLDLNKPINKTNKQKTIRWPVES